MRLDVSIIILCLHLIVFPKCDSKLDGIFILPHGGIALDPFDFKAPNETSKAEAISIHNACLSLATHIRNLQSDLLFLVTPHGIADRKNFLFYLNPNASGVAETDNCACPPCCYEFSAKIPVDIAEDLVEQLTVKYNVSGLAAFGAPGQADDPFPLRWGEVIPLYFINSSTPVAILSAPYRRYDSIVAMIPEILSLGSYLGQYLEKLSPRVSVIISADLAHTHDPNGPYGYSPAAEPFDLAIASWVESQDPYVLLSDAAQLVNDAKSCGFPGFVMAQGMMDATELSWDSSVLVNYHPSYYGMMVASLLRAEK